MDFRTIPNVGNTPLVIASRLGDYLGLDSLLLKLERNNPTGSHKDRVANANISAAIDNKNPGITIGTCGSYGIALMQACQAADFPCKIFVPKRYHNKKSAYLSQFPDRVEMVPGNYEDAIEISNSFAKKSGFFNGNPFGLNSELCFSSYESMATEILKDCPNLKHSIWLPVGNGTTFTGMYRGFEKHKVYPQWGAVSSKNNSAVLQSMRLGKNIIFPESKLDETKYNEPLVSCIPPSNIEEMIGYYQSGRVCCPEVTDQELCQASNLLKDIENIQCAPYAAAGLAGLMKAKHIRKVDPNSAHIIVLSS